MKKTYINPTIECVKLQSLQLLSGSGPETGLTAGGKGDLGSGISSGNLSHEDDFDW